MIVVYKLCCVCVYQYAGLSFVWCQSIYHDIYVGWAAARGGVRGRGGGGGGGGGAMDFLQILFV